MNGLHTYNQQQNQQQSQVNFNQAQQQRMYTGPGKRDTE